jgi:predicted small lipoprotein YifL
MIFKTMLQTILGRLPIPLKSLLVFSTLGTGLLLSGCGQKGPLTLPTAAAPTGHATSHSTVASLSHTPCA